MNYAFFSLFGKVCYCVWFLYQFKSLSRSKRRTKQGAEHFFFLLTFLQYFTCFTLQIGSRLTFDAHDDINVINFYQTRPSLMFDDSEKFPVFVMNSGDPLRSDGFPETPSGGPLGWFMKFASGFMTKSLTMPPIWLGCSICPPVEEKTTLKLRFNSIKLHNNHYLVRWKACQDVLGRKVSRAGGKVVRHSRNRTYHSQSRESRARRDHQVKDS